MNFFLYLFLFNPSQIRMENCCIDSSNVIKIPQNEKIFFTIKTDSVWNHSISITFDISQEINFLNLFFILKSYVISKDLPPFAIATTFRIHDSKILVTQKENTSFFKKMSYDSFLEWIHFRIKNDWEYEKSQSFYSIIIMFDKKLLNLQINQFNRNILSTRKPIYPWTDEWLNYHANIVSETEILKNKIKILEDKLKSFGK